MAAKNMIKSFCCNDSKPLTKFGLGERYSYINDRLLGKGIIHFRAEISEEMAIAMAKTVGYMTDGIMGFGNKDYVCVAVDEDLVNKRVFVYRHDFSYFLYIVCQGVE